MFTLSPNNWGFYMHLLTFIENIYFDALSEHYIIIYEIYATKDYC